jgi:hypothetical protein
MGLADASAPAMGIVGVSAADEVERRCDAADVTRPAVLDCCRLLVADGQFQALSAFPGPLSATATSPQDIASWLGCSLSDELSQQSLERQRRRGADPTASQASMRLLHGVLASRLLRGGRLDCLQGLTTTPEQVAAIQASLGTDFTGLDQGCDLAVAAALLREGEAATRTALQARTPATTSTAAADMSASEPPASLEVIDASRARAEEFLQCGDPRRAALELAAVRDWGRAFALAASHDQSTVQEVKGHFVRTGLQPGEVAAVWLKPEGADGALPDEQLSQWRQQALTVVAARRATAQSSLLRIANRLWDETRDPWAAQGVLLLAGAKLQQDAPGAKLVLLGCDHAADRTRFRRDCRAWQLTEAYELGEHLSGMTSPASQLHPFRLLYAMQLADHGLREGATRYALACREAVAATMASTAGRLPFNAAFVGMLDEFVHRICTATGTDSGFPTTAAAARAKLAALPTARPAVVPVPAPVPVAAPAPVFEPLQSAHPTQQLQAADQTADQAAEQAVSAPYTPPVPSSSSSRSGRGRGGGKARGAKRTSSIQSRFAPAPLPGAVAQQPPANQAAAAAPAAEPATAAVEARRPRTAGGAAPMSESKGSDDKASALPGAGPPAGKAAAGESSSMFDLGILSSGLSGIRSMFIPKTASLVTFEVPAEELEEMKKEQKVQAAAATGPPIMPPAAAPAGQALAAPPASHTPPSPSAHLQPSASGSEAAPAEQTAPPPSSGRRGRKRIASRYVTTFGSSS